MATLTLSEVSKRFKVNRSTIYRAVSSGKLSRLNDGSFDLAEVLRVFGEPSAQIQDDAPTPTAIDASTEKLINHLERELEFYKQQIEQKDQQINHLQTLLEYRPTVAPETSQQRGKATHCDIASATLETQSDQGIQSKEALHSNTMETPSSIAQQHTATLQNDATATQSKPTLIGRIGRGFKAFIKD